MARAVTAENEFLDISHDDIPIKIQEIIDSKPFSIEILYNEPHDIYTANFFDDKDQFVGAAKLTYGQNLLKSISARYNLKTEIIPLDIAREQGGQKSGNPRVSIDNFGKSVFLVVFRG